jgi:hypothetical protein
VRWRGGGPGRSGNLEQTAGGGQTPGEKRRAPRVEIGLAREFRVEPLETLSGLEEQGWRVASDAGGKGDLSAQ